MFEINANYNRDYKIFALLLFKKGVELSEETWYFIKVTVYLKNNLGFFEFNQPLFTPIFSLRSKRFRRVFGSRPNFAPAKYRSLVIL